MTSVQPLAQPDASAAAGSLERQQVCERDTTVSAGSASGHLRNHSPVSAP